LDAWIVIWAVSITVILALVGFDLYRHVKHPHEPPMRESVAWLSFYVGLAVAFGVCLGFFWEWQRSGEFFAGFLTEYSLSFDNLFVFILILSTFKVPREAQSEVLLIGIVLALVFRAILIAVGAVVIAAFSWVFIIFGAFLIYTAISFIRKKDEDEEFKENVILRVAKRFFSTTDSYDGTKVRTVVDGKKMFTPMMLVMVAIGCTDVMFALDSIPAIFGLTREPYIVFMANAFALLGLRQLYFLLDRMVKKLRYITQGLAFILAFIGVKMIMEAMHTNELPFINGGQHIEWMPEIPTLVSLGVIIATLLLVLVASAAKNRSEARAAAASKAEKPAPRHSELDSESTAASKGEKGEEDANEQG
jgi:tellurite resistance protein TerC